MNKIHCLLVSNYLLILCKLYESSKILEHTEIIHLVGTSPVFYLSTAGFPFFNY